MRLTRRQFITAACGSVFAATAGGCYTRWGEPNWLEVTQRRVPLGPAGAAFRLLHLSDFHASPEVDLALIEESVSLGLAQKPDLIALTGDYITTRLHEPERFQAALARLSAAAPTFACLGNHDGGRWAVRAGGYDQPGPVVALLRAAGVDVLTNASRTEKLRGRVVQVLGVGDLWSGACDPGRAFAETSHRSPDTRIVLSHNPDAKERLRRHAWDLMLCGHTHGGQLRLPVLGTPFAPVVDRRFVAGLHRWEDRWLFVTRGVGNLHGLRFNCRPEVSVLEIG